MTPASGSAIWIALLSLSIGLLASAWTPNPKHMHSAAETGFLDRTLEIDGITRRYQVYVPFGWTRDKKWPVIIFLHGAGERG